jgi:hypothetical protein
MTRRAPRITTQHLEASTDPPGETVHSHTSARLDCLRRLRGTIQCTRGIAPPARSFCSTRLPWASKGMLLVQHEVYIGTLTIGFHSIYGELGPGKRVSLSKLAVEHLKATGRPLRLAIDIAIWQFQAQAAKGTWRMQTRWNPFS